MKKCLFGLVCALACFFIFDNKVYAFPVQGILPGEDNYSYMSDFRGQGSYIFGTDDRTIQFGYNKVNTSLTDGSCNSSYTTFLDDMSKHCFFKNPMQSNVGDYLFPGLGMWNFYGDGPNSWFTYVYKLENGDYLRAGETHTISLAYAFKIGNLTLEQILGVTDFTSASNFIANAINPSVEYPNMPDQWSQISNYNRTYNVVDGSYFNGPFPEGSYVFIYISFDYTPSADVSSFLIQAAYAPTVTWGNYMSSMSAFYYPFIYHDYNFEEDYDLVDIPISDRSIVFSGVSSGNIFLKTCYKHNDPTAKVDFTGSFSYLTSSDLNVPNIEYLDREEIEFDWFYDFYEYDQLFGFKFDLYGSTDRIGIFYVTDYIVQQDITYDKEEVPDNIFQKAWNWFKGLFNKNKVGSEEVTKNYLNSMRDARCSFYIPKGMHYSKNTFVTKPNDSTTIDNDYIAYSQFDYVDSNGVLHNVGHQFSQTLEDNSLSFNHNFVLDSYKSDIGKFTSPLNVLSKNMNFVSSNLNSTLYSFISIIFIILILLFILKINK